MPIGYTTSDYLLLDADNSTVKRVVAWSKRRTKKWKLGSVLITKTSDQIQMDLFGNKLYHFGIIFGKRLPWQEIMFHINEAFKDNIVEKKFVKMRFQGFITERINRKNARIGPPKIFKCIANGDAEGVFEYMRWWKYNKDVLDYET